MTWNDANAEPEAWPPSVGDVLHVGRLLGYPVLEGTDVALDAGEAAWRAGVTHATASAVWAVLQQQAADEREVAAARSLVHEAEGGLVVGGSGIEDG